MTQKGEYMDPIPVGILSIIPPLIAISLVFLEKECGNFF
jgi:hypothetical protein